MRAITVARRPLCGSVAQNTLKHGTGGLNIDGCRIAPTTERDRKLYDDNMLGPARADVEKLGTKMVGYEGKWRVNPEATVNKGARWPANLILQHPEGCQRAGTRKVRAISGGVTSGDNAFGQDMGWNSHQNHPTAIRRPGEDGVETVEAWSCAPRCPVRDLDEQVGWLKSGNVKPGYMRNSTTQESRGGYEGGFGDSPLSGYGDSGGASRFFKQVGGPQMDGVSLELVEYLRKLISTPDETALYVGDLAQFDWEDASNWASESLVGVIAMGCPTEEQTTEFMRLLRPGAHFLLIAPDTQPTGHTGACCLEDGGFEIRDSILLAEGETRLHYVPKVTGKERNEGFWRGGAQNKHPTLKPVLLMERLLGDVPQGEVIDPFVGSGTTGMACASTGHNFTGHDREEEYIEVADARIRPRAYANISRDVRIESDFKAPEPKEVSMGELFGWDEE